MNDRKSGRIFVVAAATLWSTAGLFMGLLASMNVWTILFWRSLFGATLVFVVATLLWCASPKPLLLDRAVVIATLFSALGMIAFVPALQLTSVANVAMIHASLPLVAAIASSLVLRERPTRTTLISSGFILFGAILIFAGTGRSSVGQLGNFLALLMTLSMAAMTVSLRASHSGNTLWMVGTSNSVAAIVAAWFTPAMGVSVTEVATLLCFAIFQMAGGLVLYGKGARLLPSSEVALLSLVETPLSPLWVWLFFDQHPSTPSMLGGTVIIVAIAAHLLQQRSR
ncbi:DMT family transporter [Rhizobium sp. ARZ01]|uniref:DMT family transporter n=1 Tax=Rhizobium sp. ARZ01 TaxID=2769313 RepID=UPI0017870374|nr:DMT family transporter [Rhizobium sp. ARZ01]MBD9375491.1 DMT family transporter [Rhizobium sp. ARZ01]